METRGREILAIKFLFIALMLIHTSCQSSTSSTLPQSTENKNQIVVKDSIEIQFNQFKKLDDKFFFRVEYTVSKGWFGDAEEIIKTCLHFAPTNIVSKYDISYEGIDGKDEKYSIKIYSNSDKETLQKYLDSHSTRAESYKVL